MRSTRLGKSGLRVSRLALGTMTFGQWTTEKEAFAIMDKAVEMGINLFDTADIYDGTSAPAGNGVTEEVIGRWFAQGGGRRDYVVLGTKVHGAMVPVLPLDPNCRRGLNARKIIRGCEASLRRLQTDRIDLYQLHHVDRECPAEEWIDAMTTLRRQGKIYYVGSSNFAGWDIATACLTAKSLQSPSLVSEQSVYNLTNRTIELEVLPACRHHGLGLLVWSPLAQGLLAGALSRAARGHTHRTHVTNMMEIKRVQLEAYEQICREFGEHPANVGLAWLLANPVVTAPIIGARTADHLAELCRAVEIDLGTDVLAKLDKIFPGPGGEAPVAYAW